MVFYVTIPKSCSFSTIFQFLPITYLSRIINWNFMSLSYRKLERLSGSYTEATYITNSNEVLLTLIFLYRHGPSLNIRHTIFAAPRLQDIQAIFCPKKSTCFSYWNNMHCPENFSSSSTQYLTPCVVWPMLCSKARNKSSPDYICKCIDVSCHMCHLLANISLQ